MFSIAFIISLIRVATFVIFAVLLEKIYYYRKLNSEQKKIFKHNSLSNLSAYLIIGFSVSTILNTTADSYIYRISSVLAIYGPWMFILTGFLIYIKNVRYNINVRNKILDKSI